MIANNTTGKGTSDRGRKLLIMAALGLALLAGGWLFWLSIRGVSSPSGVTPIHLSPELTQLMSQPYWREAWVTVSNKGEVRIYENNSYASVSQCYMDVRRSEMHFAYHVQSQPEGTADANLMSLASAIVSNPDFDVSDDLRQKLQQVLPVELAGGPASAIDQVDNDTQSAWITVALAKNATDRRAAADKLLTRIMTWRDQWLAGHKAEYAAVLVKVRALISPEQEKTLTAQWQALQFRSAFSSMRPGMRRRPTLPAPKPSTAPTP